MLLAGTSSVVVLGSGTVVRLHRLRTSRPR